MADISTLTDAQVQKINQAMVSGFSKPELDELVGMFKEQNATAITPANAPGAPKAPLPIGLDPRAKHIDAATAPSQTYEDRQSSNAQVNQTMENWQNDPSSALARYFRQNAVKQGDPHGVTMSDIGSLIPGIGSDAAAMTGPLATLTGLSSATTKTPADLLTQVALMGAGSAFQGSKALTQPANSIKRALQGVGMFEGGSRLHALLSGQPQPPVNPLNRNPMDLLGAVLSGGLGLAQGASEVPSASFKRAQAAQQAQGLWDSHQAQARNLNTQIQQASQDIADANTEIKPAENAHEDAVTRLRNFIKTLNAKQSQTTGDEKQAFQTQQRQYRLDEKDLKFQIENQQKVAADAHDALKTHQGSLKSSLTSGGAESSEDVANRVLELQKRLDNLRNPELAEATAGAHPEAGKIQAKIDKWQSEIDSGKYNEGAVTQKESAIETAKNQLDDLSETNVRSAIDDTKAKIRDLKTQQRRLESGKFADVPTDEALAAAVKTLDLQGAHSDAQRSLDELNRKYQSTALARLQHAKSAPGSSPADVDDVLRHQTLEERVRKTLENRRFANIKPDQLKAQREALKTSLAKLREAAPAEPQETKSGALSAVISSVFKKASPGLAGAEFGSLMHVSPTIGALLGILGNKGLNSDAGQKLLQFFNRSVGPSATQMIPSVVNQTQQQ